MNTNVKNLDSNNDEIEFSSLTDDEKIDLVAKRVLEKHRRAFEVLAQ